MVEVHRAVWRVDLRGGLLSVLARQPCLAAKLVPGVHGDEEQLGLCEIDGLFMSLEFNGLAFGHCIV